MILAALNDILVTLANLNPLVNEAFAGDVYEVNAKENKFGCFVATPMTALRSEGGTITYTYTLYYIDRLTKDEKNMDFVQSDAVTMLKGLIDKVEGEGVEVGEDYQFTLFRHNFDDWCAGAYVSVDFTVPDTDCGEFDFNVVIDLRPITITRNGKFIPQGFDGFSEVLVDIEGGGPSMEEIDEEIDKKLVGYATEEWVEGQGYLTEHQSLIDYAKKTDIPSLTGYATESWVERWVGDKHYLTQHQSLADYAKKSEIPSLTGYATQSWVEGKRYATESWVENKHYLTQHQDLSSYAKKSEIPSLTGYATESWVKGQGYLTQHQSLADYAKKSDIPSLTGYATQSWVENWVEGQGYLTQHQDLSDYAKKSEIPSLTGYATQSWVESKGYLTEHQSLAGYATQSWVEGKGYLTQHQSLADYALKSEIPSLTGYATESWVEGQGYLTEHQSLVGYATESWVEDKGYLTEHQDISGKFDKSSVWTGTQAQWESLTEIQRASYTIALITE